MKRIRAEVILAVTALGFFLVCAGLMLSGRGYGTRVVLSRQPQSAASYETPTPEKINLNTASAEELTALPGIGETLAARIVAYREAHGAFQTLDALLEVEGIGEKRLGDIAAYVTLEE